MPLPFALDTVSVRVKVKENVWPSDSEEFSGGSHCLREDRAFGSALNKM